MAIHWKRPHNSLTLDCKASAACYKKVELCNMNQEADEVSAVIHNNNNFQVVHGTSDGDQFLGFVENYVFTIVLDDV